MRIAFPRLTLSILLTAFCLTGVAASPALADAGAGAATVASEDKRFIDHGNQTVTDTRSGLMWQKNDSYLRTHHWLSWDEAADYIRTLNREAFAGFIDWRLPTLEELKTLYEADKVNSKQIGREMVIHIDPIFGREGSGAHWSSEPNGHFNAFGVVFNTGDQFSAPKSARSRKSIRAVRQP